MADTVTYDAEKKELVTTTETVSRQSVKWLLESRKGYQAKIAANQAELDRVDALIEQAKSLGFTE